MIELKADRLVFTFPDVHEGASFAIDFQRTLRIPDDDRDHLLPPGLGSFPLRHVDDFASNVPDRWLAHGGVMLPMYQSEAMWLNFTSSGRSAFAHPFAVKIATGKIDAVTGEAWSDGLHRDQDYVVVPEQPWLDGYCVEKGIIRQFVAMPLGAGYTAEEQITGEAAHGGVQVIAYPMKREAYLRRRKAWERHRREGVYSEALCLSEAMEPRAAVYDMGLAPGGRMRQEIYDDPYDFDEWDTASASRCFVHIANSLVWRAITGSPPPTTPPTAKEYTAAGLPWFEYYGGDRAALEGSPTLAGLESVLRLGEKKGDVPLPENEPVAVERVVRLRRGLAPGQVREGRF